jgi:hypothetical protein
MTDNKLLQPPPNYGTGQDGAIQMYSGEKNFWNFYEYIAYSVMKNREQAQKAFYSNAWDIRKFADIIFNNKKIRLADFVDLNTYRTILGQLVNSWQKQGLFEPYISFFRWLFGLQTIIKIEIPAPAVIHIIVSNYNLASFLRKLEIENRLRKIEDNVNYRIATQIVLDVTTNELLGFLNTLLPTGMVCEFEFFMDGDG